MTEQYDDTNRGVLFKNDRKETERQPDYTGKINVKGTEQRLAGWIRQSKAGKSFLSISVSDPMPEDRHDAAPEAKPTTDDLNDEVPF